MSNWEKKNLFHSKGWVYSLSKSVLDIVKLPYRIPIKRRLAFFVKSLSIDNTLNRDIATLSSSLDLVRSISSPAFTYMGSTILLLVQPCLKTVQELRCKGVDW